MSPQYVGMIIPAFPTCVGMNRADDAYAALERCVPYMCGDEPQMMNDAINKAARSLHVWG